MKYTPPRLNGHSVPYKGKRHWVIEVDTDYPFEWVDSEVANYAVYDKAMGYVIATIQTQEDGKFWVQLATQSDSGFEADDLRDAAQSAGAQEQYMMKKGWD